MPKTLDVYQNRIAASGTRQSSAMLFRCARLVSSDELSGSGLAMMKYDATESRPVPAGATEFRAAVESAADVADPLSCDAEDAGREEVHAVKNKNAQPAMRESWETQN